MLLVIFIEGNISDRSPCPVNAQNEGFESEIISNNENADDGPKEHSRAVKLS